LFARFLKVERAHHKMFTSVLTAVDASEPLPDAPVHVCQECGNTVIGQRPDVCKFCGQPGEQFMEVV
jgi:rubrerythrin